MKEPGKFKRKRISANLAPLNDGTDTPAPVPGAPMVLKESEAALFKQAGNPLGDPHKI